MIRAAMYVNGFAFIFGALMAALTFSRGAYILASANTVLSIANLILFVLLWRVLR